MEPEKRPEAARAPDALADGQVMVTLLDGSTTVIVEEWSWAKMVALGKIINDLEKFPFIVEQSVRPQDREKLKSLKNADIARIGAAALKLNMTPELAGEMKALGLLMGPPRAEEPSTPSPKS